MYVKKHHLETRVSRHLANLSLKWFAHFAPASPVSGAHTIGSLVKHRLSQKSGEQRADIVVIGHLHYSWRAKER